MGFLPGLMKRSLLGVAVILMFAADAPAQQPDGPQTDAPPAVVPPPAPPRSPGQKLTVPSGTRLAVVLK